MDDGEGVLPPYTVSVAPMLDCTDRHYRYFARLCSRGALLYTEMIPAGAIVHGDVASHLGFRREELPVALQIGSGDVDECARAITAAEKYADAQGFGYSEYNLNVGCPSPRVQRGCFGAALMEHPRRVADIVRAMKTAAGGASGRPVTVKHRLGIGWTFSYDVLREFADTVLEAGADRLIVHARTAVLEGLDPKQNRTIPAISYPAVYRLKQETGALVEINGEIASVGDIRGHLHHVDGVMIGRAVYNDMWFLTEIEREIFGGAAQGAGPRGGASLSIDSLVGKIIDYCTELEAEARAAARGDGESGPGRVPRHRIVAHLAGLFRGQPGGARWRRALHDGVHGGAPLGDAIADAYRVVQELQASA